MTKQDTSAPNYAGLYQKLPLVRKPGQYLGLERHAAGGELTKDTLNFCLVFPDLYEIGMSHQGLQILYQILNNEDGVCAHRAYAPDTDMEALLREQHLPLFSLEAGAPLGRYDALGITLPYELCYTNILTVLDLAGLPWRASERDERHPFIVGGGSCAFNPEPVADFFDAILLGDGEEAVLSIAAILRREKTERQTRMETLRQLAEVPGMYIPAFFKPRFCGRTFQGMEPLLPGYARVRRAILPALDSGAILHKPLVPAVKPVHDRLAMEIARGCTRGCRFCQAGIIYRPVRERRMAEILDWAEQGIEASGFEELALLSLSTGDYSCVNELVLALMNRFSERRVSLSMPSMRVGTLTPAIMEQIRRVRKTGFTVAPEAGSERLRRVINKGITEEDLLATCQNAFALGWKLIKFYFMLGLPTETEADVEAIAALTRLARSQAGKAWKSVQINIGVGVFVPKAHTAFQWEEQLGIEAAHERLQMLKTLLPPKGFHLKWHEPEQSFLEGVFSRGGRELSGLIEEAWRRGARFDGWGEHFHLPRWQEAAATCGIELNDYLHARSVAAPLPWEHLDPGVKRDFLLRERMRAFQEKRTSDCRSNGCQGCGICDFKEVRPVLHPEKVDAGGQSAGESGLQRSLKGPVYRVSYSRVGKSALLGHLELLQLVFRALRRAGLPLAYSQGFNPTPKVSFSQALPLGMESQAEFFDMELTHPVSCLDAGFCARLNSELPPGMRVVQIAVAPKKNAACVKALYEVTLPQGDMEAFAASAEHFLAQKSFPLTRTRRRKENAFDMRPLVASLRIESGELMVELLHHQGQAGVNPRDVLEQVFGLSREEALLCHVLKKSCVDVVC